MYWVTLFLVFVTTVMVAAIVIDYIFRKRRQVSERLLEIKKMEKTPEDEDALKLPFSERVIQPLYNNLGSALGNLAPKEIRNNIEQRMVYAGSSETLDFNKLTVSMLIFGMFFGVLFAFIFSRVLLITGGRLIIGVFVTTVIGLYFPLLVLNSQAANRQKEMQKELPDILDLLLVSVEAGLGFDMALKRVTDKMPGDLSKEFSRGLEEIKRGKRREEAFRGIARRTGVSDVSSFVTAVIQSEQLGSNIANTLRIQADTMRRKRRQRAEETAMKAPIKMLFPMIFFILPTLFIVILGPAIISIVEMFSTSF